MQCSCRNNGTMGLKLDCLKRLSYLVLLRKLSLSIKHNACNIDCSEQDSSLECLSGLLAPKTFDNVIILRTGRNISTILYISSVYGLPQSYL
jgi:hypothetical protein